MTFNKFVRWNESALKDGLSYISESKRYIFVAIGLFFLSGIFGFVMSAHLGFID